LTTGEGRLTVSGTHVEVLIESRSRFVAAIARVTSVDEARAFIRERRAAVPEANHHAYAFVVGHGASVVDGMSDAGEPSGTAGPPTMTQLKSSGLGDACVVVSRIFGGVKLGTGGLARAYGAAARLVIDAVPKVETRPRRPGRAVVSYAMHEPVRRLLLQRGAVISAVEFLNDVRIDFEVDADSWSALERTIADVTAGTARVLAPDQPSGGLGSTPG
jgi:uncharacterized YigZ family protein